jgi:hypothetical protein
MVIEETSLQVVALAWISLLAVASCGSAHGTPAAHGSISPASAVSSPPPLGGLVPVELRGVWSMVDGYAPGQKLVLTADAFRFIQARGSAVVNGDEIDLFMSPGCISELGYDAVGRYMWTHVGSLLHFTALNADPCERRDIFNNVSFALISHTS